MRNGSSKIPRKTPWISEESSPMRVKEKVIKGRKSTIKNKPITAGSMQGEWASFSRQLHSSLFGRYWAQQKVGRMFLHVWYVPYSLNEEAPFEAEVLVWNP